MSKSMDEDFCLRWNDHHNLVWGTMERLINNQNMTDVTLSLVNGTRYKAHRLVLSACSPYFEDLFSTHDPRAIAVVYLKGISPFHMQLLLQYMYKGEVNVEESEIMSLLDAAKDLQIKGLTEAAEKMCQRQKKDNEEVRIKYEDGLEEEEEVPEEEEEEEEEENMKVETESLLLSSSLTLLEEGEASTRHSHENVQLPSRSHRRLPMKKPSLNGSDTVCLDCGKKFTHRWMLERHSTTHSGIQRFSCSICDRKFSHQASAARHIKNVHKEKNTCYLVNKLNENAFQPNMEEVCHAD